MYQVVTKVIEGCGLFISLPVYDGVMSTPPWADFSMLDISIVSIGGLGAEAIGVESISPRAFGRIVRYWHPFSVVEQSTLENPPHGGGGRVRVCDIPRRIW